MYNQTVATTDVNGNVTEMVYDNLGNLERTIDANGGITVYTSDAFGERTRAMQLDPVSNSTSNVNYTILSDVTYLYDLMGHEIESASGQITMGSVALSGVAPGAFNTSPGDNRVPTTINQVNLVSTLMVFLWPCARILLAHMKSPLSKLRSMKPSPWDDPDDLSGIVPTTVIRSIKSWHKTELK